MSARQQDAVVFLYVPAHEPRKIDRALATPGADVVILDLEDGVPADGRAAARAAVAALEGGPVLCRVSGVGSAEHAHDVAAAAAAAGRGALAGVVLAKAEGAEHVTALAEALPGTPVWPLVESSAGVELLPTLAGVADRIGGLMLGAGDLLATLNGRWTPDELPLLYARSRLIHTAAAWGIAHAVDTPDPNLVDLDLLQRRAEAARALGMTAKAVIHPRQIPVVRDAFAPQEAELAWARSVVAGPDGSRVERDEVVDEATRRRARRLLAAAGEPA